MAFEERLDYLAASSFRFYLETATCAELKAGHNAILHGKTTDLRQDVYEVEQLISRNGNIHKPAMPTQGVLVLAESTIRLLHAS